MPICPSCKKDDRIYRVSAIYSGGISQGTFSTTEGTVDGTSQTVISRKLAPLPKPTISCFVNGCSGLFIVSGAFWILFPLLLGENKLDLSLIGPGVPTLVIGLGIYLLASLFVKSQMPRWRTAMKIWERCYYCDRDGIVFDPTNETAIPVDAFNNYLRKTTV